jgi:hypothetical protein
MTSGSILANTWANLVSVKVVEVGQNVTDLQIRDWIVGHGRGTDLEDQCSG